MKTCNFYAIFHVYKNIILCYNLKVKDKSYIVIEKVAPLKGKWEGLWQKLKKRSK